MKTKKLLTTLAIVSVVLMAGCKKDDFVEITGVCPEVIFTSPDDGDINVPLEKIITATFNKKMNSATITETSFTIEESTAERAATIEGTVSYSDSDSTATFTPPSGTLMPGAAYEGRIKTSVKDPMGNALQTDYVWTFTTIPQLTVSSFPSAGGTTDGSGTFDEGSVVTVTATPNLLYTFTNWTVNDSIVSTSSNYHFTMSGNKELVANFSTISIGNFAVNLSSIPAAGGTTNGQGSYGANASVTINASPNVGYTFTNWTEGGIEVSPNAGFTFSIIASRTLVANFTLIPALGPAIIDLGTAIDFEVATKSGISTTGVSSIIGNIGVSPASATAITGFGLIMNTDMRSSHTPIVSGNVYAANYAAPTPAKLTKAVNDMQTAYTTANNLVVPAPVVALGAGNISGMTLAPGLYKWSTGLLITDAGVTLAGGPNDTWVFQIGQNLTVNNGAIIHLSGGAKAKNIFWIVAGEATLGTTVDFSGNILCKTLISLNTGAKVTGRLYAQTAVTLNASTVIQP